MIIVNIRYVPVVIEQVDVLVAVYDDKFFGTAAPRYVRYTGGVQRVDFVVSAYALVVYVV